MYRINSRNLSFGVYDGEEGFIGLRDKFGLYLFTEYHHDQGAPYGTVKPIECLEKVPDDIPARKNEYPYTIDRITRRPVEFEKTTGEKYKGKWYFADTGEFPQNRQKIQPCNYGNVKLFKWLLKKEKEHLKKLNNSLN